MKYEQEMDDLKKNMTVKLQKKKEGMECSTGFSSCFVAFLLIYMLY